MYLKFILIERFFRTPGPRTSYFDYKELIKNFSSNNKFREKLFTNKFISNE